MVSNISIPKRIYSINKALKKAGFEAYIVGGCVRDILMHRKPKDWDFTTNADPKKIMNLFEHHFYNNKYGTVTIVDETQKDKTLKNIEITPYRTESGYSDKRRPDSIAFAKDIGEDLKRRDFTINAIALDIDSMSFIDPYKGHFDIKERVLRAVGDAHERFNEDALRMMRAVRIATELDFKIEQSTKNAIQSHIKSIASISAERIRDEFSRIVMSDNPKRGLELLEELGLLQFVLPELRAGIGIEQNEAHAFDVWEHSLRTLQHGANKKWSFHVRLSALFHDIAKPQTRRWSKEKKNWTFYGHDVVGARVARKILTRMKYPKETIEIVTKLVRYHLFFSDIDIITLSAVRRLVRNVGKENIWDLMKLRACDRIGTGRPKEAPYRLRKYESMIEEVLRDPISVSMLAVNGSEIMKYTRLQSGPKIGYILNALLEEVLDDPQRNNKEHLLSRAEALSKLNETALKKMGDIGKEKREKAEQEKVAEIRKKHWVK